MPRCLPCRSSALLLSLLASSQAHSAPVALDPQTNNTFSATVSDPSGAQIPGATIHIEGRSFEQNGITDDQGRFSIQLSPGTYKIFVTAPGFEPFVRDNVSVGNKALKPLGVVLHRRQRK